MSNVKRFGHQFYILLIWSDDNVKKETDAPKDGSADEGSIGERHESEK